MIVFRKELKMKLDNQALGAIMMALQKSLLEQSDIVPVLKNMEFAPVGADELTVVNPPVVHVTQEQLGEIAGDADVEGN